MFTIAAVDPDAPDARALLAELGAALAAITGSDGSASFDAADVRGPRSCFFVAYAADGSPAGCGALRPLAPPDGGVAELKRMYARPGSGAGSHLLAALESKAQALGYRAVWLETRRVNERAVAFYARHGYAVIPNYGKYAGRREAVCLGRDLHAPARSHSYISNRKTLHFARTDGRKPCAPAFRFSYKMPPSTPFLTKGKTK